MAHRDKGAETINPCTENRKQATAMSLEYVCVFAMDHRLLLVIIPPKKKKKWLSSVTFLSILFFLNKHISISKEKKECTIHGYIVISQ